MLNKEYQEHERAKDGDTLYVENDYPRLTRSEWFAGLDTHCLILGSYPEDLLLQVC